MGRPLDLVESLNNHANAARMRGVQNFAHTKYIHSNTTEDINLLMMLTCYRTSIFKVNQRHLEELQRIHVPLNRVNTTEDINLLMTFTSYWTSIFKVNQRDLEE